MKKIAVFIVFLGLFSLAQAQEKPVATLLGPQEYSQLLHDDQVQLIDVRTPEEFKEGHVDGAVNIDFLSEDFSEKMSELDKDKPVLIYCRSGNRSGKAAVILKADGFKDITDLKGGYMAWENYFEN